MSCSKAVVPNAVANCNYTMTPGQGEQDSTQDYENKSIDDIIFEVLAGTSLNQNEYMLGNYQVNAKKLSCGSTSNNTVLKYDCDILVGFRSYKYSGAASKTLANYFALVRAKKDVSAYPSKNYFYITNIECRKAVSPKAVAECTINMN